MSVGRPMHELGDVIAGRFEVLEVLGEGGMGIVYRVTDRQSGSVVALKSMSRRDIETLVRFKDEFRSVADVRHPNLVRLEELVELGGDVFFTMEFVDGIDLMSWVRPPAIDPDQATIPGWRGSRFEGTHLRAALVQLAEALGALHEANRVHRDIKPSNILVTSDGRVVLMDFGLSVQTKEGQQLSDIVAAGTAAYMAPEQAAGLPVGPAADWYSVGVLLFEAMTGRLPFPGGALEMISGKLAHEAPLADEVCAGLPADLVALCRDLLRRDVRLRPTGADVQRRLARGASDARRLPAAPSPPASSTFVGRRAELTALAARFDRARHEAVLQIVVGESGVGKTAVVQELVRGLAGTVPDLIVLTGRCHERESLAYKAFDGVVDALARTLRRMSVSDLEAVMPRHEALLGVIFPALGRVDRIASALAAAPRIGDVSEARARAFTAFRELLVRCGERYRMVIAIDDFHRTDQESLELLSSLLGQADPPRALFILTAARTPVLDTLAQLAVEGRMLAHEVLVLGPLDPVSTRQLVRVSMSGEHLVDETRIERVASDAEGHPGFLLELVRGHAEAKDRDSLDQLLWSRIAGLPPVQRELLGLMATSGSPLTMAELSAALGVEHGALVPHVGALRALDLITATGRWRDSWVEPYHDRVVAAITSHAGADELRGWHARLAETLDPAHDPERVLTHLLAAGGGEALGELAASAGRRAVETYQLARAARLYRIALHHVGNDERWRVRSALATVLAELGESAAAAEQFLAAAIDAPDPTSLRRCAADQLLVAGDIEPALPLLGQVLETVGAPLSSGRWRTFARLAWARTRLRGALRSPRRGSRSATDDERRKLDALWSAGHGLSTIEPIVAAEYQARFLTLALTMGDDSQRCHGFALEAAMAAMPGQRARGRIATLIAEAARLARVTERPVDAGWVAFGRAVGALMLGDFAECGRAADEAVARFGDRLAGSSLEQRNARIFGILARYFAGDLREFAPRMRAAIRDADARRDRFTLGQLRGGAGNSIWLMADDPLTAIEEADAGLAEWPTPSFQMPGYYHLIAMAQAHLYAGDGRRAYEAVMRTWPRLERSMLLRIAFIAVDAAFARGRAAVAAGEMDEAARSAARIRRTGEPWGAPLADLLDAAVALERLRPERAEALLVAAEKGFVASGMEMHAAAARRGLAALTGAARWSAAAQVDARSLHEADVREPERWLAMLAPGLSPR